MTRTGPRSTIFLKGAANAFVSEGQRPKNDPLDSGPEIGVTFHFSAKEAIRSIQKETR